ncbi:MAG: hypothetical protein NTZ39_08585 [Methanoregula sp.]|nr:hypothetical protein [Methanoregula sp.]
MATDRTAMIKKLTGVFVIITLLLISTVSGEVLAPASPLNLSQSSYSNGITGSSRPDGGSPGKDSGAVGAGGNVSAVGSPSGQVTKTTSGIGGSQVSGVGNTTEISVDVQLAKAANETVAVEGTAITITKGPVSVTVNAAAEPQVKNGTIKAVIKSITMNYAPITAQFKDTGTVSASFTANLITIPPPNATISATLAERPDATAQAAFDQAVSQKGYQMGVIAYIMNVAKTNLADGTEIGQASVNMSIAPSWVTVQGGAGAVKIVRLADDGTSQVLDTRSLGLDSSGNMVFAGISPGGLSIFALVSVKSPPAGHAITPQPTSPVSLPFTSANSMLLIPPLVVFVVVLLMRRRR